MVYQTGPSILTKRRWDSAFFAIENGAVQRPNGHSMFPWIGVWGSSSSISKLSRTATGQLPKAAAGTPWHKWSIHGPNSFWDICPDMSSRFCIFAVCWIIFMLVLLGRYCNIKITMLQLQLHICFLLGILSRTFIKWRYQKAIRHWKHRAAKLYGWHFMAIEYNISIYKHI